MLSANIFDQDIHIGDMVRIHSRVVEGSRTRIQVFEGVLISLKGRGENKTFTVRKIGTGGIGVERIWPLNSKSLVKVEVKKKGKNIRRSKLYFLRNLSGKAAVRV